MLRKISIAVDCENDAERDMVQAMATDVSNMGTLKAKSIIRMKPVFDKNRNELLELFNMIAKNGVKSLMSLKGGKILSKFF